MPSSSRVLAAMAGFRSFQARLFVDYVTGTTRLFACKTKRVFQGAKNAKVIATHSARVALALMAAASIHDAVRLRDVEAYDASWSEASIQI